MRILYDGLIYDCQTAGGVSRYFSNIIRRLPDRFIPFLVASYSQRVNYPAHPRLRISRVNPFTFRPGRISFRLNRYYRSHLEFFRRPDLAHPTSYSLLTGRTVGEYRCPVVITVWDMIHEVLSKQVDPTGQAAEQKRKAIMAAQAIICISENTKRDLLERCQVPEAKITVTYLASEIDASLACGSEPVPSQPYYIYVGGRFGYKNFDGLLAALAKAVSVKPQIALCVVGSPFNKTEEKRIADLRLSDNVVNFGHTTDSHLAKLYSCSIGLVYPSLYEGFGIPLLEAMSCGTAVVASNRSSIPEVVGHAGLLFDPNATDDLADILQFLVDNPKERNRLVAEGHERLKLFSWDRTVGQTLDVYRSCMF